MKPNRAHYLVAVAAVLVFLAAGCGSSGGSSTTDDDDECLRDRDLGERRLLVDHDLAGRGQVGRRLRQEQSHKERPANGRRRREGGDADSRLRPERARQARHPGRATGKDSLDQLSTSLQQDVATIESAVKGASGLSGALKAVPTVTATLATMETQVKTTITNLARTRREGRTEDRVRELERLQLPDGQRLMNRTSSDAQLLHSGTGIPPRQRAHRWQRRRLRPAGSSS